MSPGGSRVPDEQEPVATLTPLSGHLDDYHFPEDEVWLIQVDARRPGVVTAHSQCVRTCLTFQARGFTHGRGGWQRSFPNGALEPIVEEGRCTGARIRFSRPRVFGDGANPNPVPDDPATLATWFPDDDWWRPFVNPPQDVVLRLD